MSTYTATTVPTQFVEANGIRFAYRRWGKRGGLAPTPTMDLGTSITRILFLKQIGFWMRARGLLRLSRVPLPIEAQSDGPDLS